jgi:hypothetical protein
LPSCLIALLPADLFAQDEGAWIRTEIFASNDEIGNGRQKTTREARIFLAGGGADKSIERSHASLGMLCRQEHTASQ